MITRAFVHRTVEYKASVKGPVVKKWLRRRTVNLSVKVICYFFTNFIVELVLKVDFNNV